MYTIYLSFLVLFLPFISTKDIIIPVGETPNFLLQNSNGSVAFISNYGTLGTSKGGSVSVIDLQDNVVLQTLESDAMINHPMALATTKDGNLLFIGNSYGFLSIYNIIEQSFEDKIDIPTHVRSIIMADDKQKLYVTHYFIHAKLSVVSVADRNVTKEIDLPGSLPISITSRTYQQQESILVAKQAGNISIVDVWSDKLEREIATPPDFLLFGLAMGTNDKLFVTAGTTLYNKGVVLVYEVHSGALLNQIELGSSPSSIRITKNGKLAFLINHLQSIVMIIETDDLTVKDSIQFDCKTIGKAELALDEKQLYVICVSGFIIVHPLE